MSDYQTPIAAAASSPTGGSGPAAGAPTGQGGTGNAEIDGLLFGVKWNGSVSYSFPDSASDYSSGNTGESSRAGFAQVSAAQQQAVHTIMTQVAAYTNLAIQYAGTDTADIRIAQSSAANPTAYAYYPGNGAGGDVWFGTQYNYTNPKLGDYYYLTHIHELGHALGLKHSQETGGVAGVAVPSAHDALEFTVMSYRSYVGGPLTGYTNETYGYPTTFMMNDILALQTMYGADYGTNSGNSVYTWSSTTGEMFINGVGQGRPGGPNAPASANRIFLTVWDGGGNDTYDMSNYTTGVNINLNPGSYSITASGQRAYLGGGNYAKGNVYNAYLFNNDARAYIENAIGGSAGDIIIGNAAANRLDGRAGNDTLTGGVGDDVFVYGNGYGADIITDFAAGAGGIDEIDFSGLSNIFTFADVLARSAQVGASVVMTFGAGATLTLQGVMLASLVAGDFVFASTNPLSPDDPPPPSQPDPNDAPANISLSGASVSENVSGGIVGNLSVTDPDGDTVFAFTVSDSRFEVAGTPGAYRLKLKNGVTLDYETETNVALSITAIDQGGLSVSRNFTINVVDVGGVIIVGTSSANSITSTPESDVVYGMNGNDIIRGLAGNDELCGDAGNDMLYGEDGNDVLIGGLGTDTLDGGNGNDTFVISGAGDQTDKFYGGAGTDKIVVEGPGAVTLASFNAAALSIEQWQGNGQAVLGTQAANILDFSGLQSISGLAYVDGGSGNDTIRGSLLADDLRGGAGNDSLYGGDGNDVLIGGLGTDMFDGGNGNDTFMISGTGDQTDKFYGGAGTDKIVVDGPGAVTLASFDAAASSIEQWQGNGQAVLGTQAANNLNFSGLQSISGLAYVDGGSGNDTITGSNQADNLRGGAGNDSLYGGGGDDALTGGLGNDFIDGGAGNDTIYGSGNELQFDTIHGGAGIDTLALTGSSAVTLSGFNAAASSIESLQGYGLGIIGNTSANTFDFSGLGTLAGLSYVDGGGGNDTLIGSAFSDDLRGGAGNDVLTGWSGNDLLTGGAGADTFVFTPGFGRDTITDFAAGSSVNDVIRFDQNIFASFAEVLAVAQQVGADVTITVDAATAITLKNVTLANLHTNDFQFV